MFVRWTICVAKTQDTLCVPRLIPIHVRRLFSFHFVWKTAFSCADCCYCVACCCYCLPLIFRVFIFRFISIIVIFGMRLRPLASTAIRISHGDLVKIAHSFFTLDLARVAEFFPSSIICAPRHCTAEDRLFMFRPQRNTEIESNRVREGMLLKKKRVHFAIVDMTLRRNSQTRRNTLTFE